MTMSRCDDWCREVTVSAVFAVAVAAVAYSLPVVQCLLCSGPAMVRLAQVLAVTLAIAAFIIAIVMCVGAKPFDNPHSILGLVIMLLGFLQPINAALRPKPEHPNRVYWCVTR